jgi:predicted metalloendopeptidase
MAEPAAPDAPDEGRLTPEQIASKVLSAMDREADPCEDFYRYACGDWLDATELPADESRWGRSFSVIDEENRALVREILESAAADPGDDADRRRVGRFYGSCMAEEDVEKAGARPLKPILREIGKVKDAGTLLAVTAKLHRMNVEALFGLGVIPDFKNPDLNIAFMAQGGLGMPDRDYYLSEDETKRKLLKDYEKHVARMFGLLGEKDETAGRHASEVLAFEMELAKVSRPRAEMRQVDKLYNKIDIDGLKKLTPALPWGTYFAATGYPDIVDINVATPEFFETLDKLVAKTEPGALQTYLRWYVAKSLAGALSSDFVNANFEFFSTRLLGQKELEPRWKRCVDATQEALGEVIGKVYIKRRFAGSSKDVALEMIEGIEDAFESNLPNLSWMDDATRARAREKKAAVKNKIGYPDEWLDYSSMKLRPKGYFQNTMAAIEFEFDRQARKIGNPVDPDEWLMTPQMVNAYYHPILNEIAFPAGILQPPFFHRDFPAAMNYGGIGGVIGHELTHGFDDQGRKFSPTGQMEEWWEPEASEKFQVVAQCVDDAYSKYEVEPGVSVNGKLTLGENIADIGGLKEAYQAYKDWEKRHGTPKTIVEGLTNEQLFFVSWGQVWCTVASAESERLQVTTNPHSPARFRVIGPVTHNAEFAKAFSCKKQAPMNPDDRCVVW